MAICGSITAWSPCQVGILHDFDFYSNNNIIALIILGNPREPESIPQNSFIKLNINRSGSTFWSLVPGPNSQYNDNEIKHVETDIGLPQVLNLITLFLKYILRWVLVYLNNFDTSRVHWIDNEPKNRLDYSVIIRST